MSRCVFRWPWAAVVVAAAIVGAAQSPAPSPAWLEAYREPASRLVGAALADTAAWDRLAELTDTFGHRLAGSKGLENAIDWAIGEMSRDGLENVRGEKVMVPHWVRGRESAEIVSPVRHPLVMLGLGNSVGTPAGGIEAEAVVVRSFEALDALGTALKGKIVVYNVPWTGYGETVRYRSTGASRAAAHGAIGMLLRSVGQPGLRTPHTGALSYAPEQPQIPAAAIANEDADRLQRLQDRGQKLVVRLMMEARMLPDAESANVIGEIVGRERPEEIVVLGCHFDSWDVGTGATDDGGGCIASWEALRLMKKLGLRPRRTVRVVLFTNEENGLRGGLAYREQHAAELANHRPDGRNRRRRVPAARLRVLGQRPGEGHGESRRVAAGRHRRDAHRRVGRRRRHRPERAGREGALDVAGCRRRAVFHDSPHGGRHGRQD